jgi:hypothetical protein
MTERNSYPSPNAAATRPGAPFYPNSGMSPPTHVPELHLHDHPEPDNDEKDDTAALTQHLQEQLAQHMPPELQPAPDPIPDPNIMQVDGEQGHHAQAMAREVMNLHPEEENHVAQQYGSSHTPKEGPATPGAAGASVGKPRTKVSRACDECRRKKVYKEGDSK